METKKRAQSARDVLDWVDSIVWAVVVLLLVFTFAVRVVRVDGDSMNYTLLDGEKLLISSLPYTPRHGDIVVTDAGTNYGKVIIKRVIGCPGDTIAIDFTSGVVYRNGEPLEEPYAAAPTFLEEGTQFPVTVPDGKLFLMGDNRNVSLDSRSTELGLVDVRNIMGRVLLRLTPLNKLGVVG